MEARPSLQIRPIDVRDALEVGAAADVIRRGYHALPGYRAGDDYDDVITAVADRADETDVMVAVDGTRVLGCLTYVRDHDNPHAEHGDPDAATFRFFAVDPDAQGSGVGRAMVEWVVARARTDGKARIRMHTLVMMEDAMRLYAALGFVRDPDRDADWDGDIGLGYVLHLDPA